MSNKNKEVDGEEEDVGATQASIEDNSPIKEYEKGCEYYREDDPKDTGLPYEKNSEEESSSRHKGESLLSDSSDSDDNDDDDDKTGAKDNTCYSNGDGANSGDGGGDSTGAGGGSVEWLRFLSSSTLL